jgi:hypothetical protein
VTFSFCRPSRALWLAVMVFLVALATGYPMQAEAASQSKTASSYGCFKKFDSQNGFTYGCARLTGPTSVTAGVPFRVTLAFRARVTMEVRLVVADPTSRRDVVSRLVRVKAGHLATVSGMITMPSTATSSTTREGTSPSAVTLLGQALPTHANQQKCLLTLRLVQPLPLIL